jgi:hypothetical protein
MGRFMGGDKSRTGRRGVTLMTGQRSAFRHFSECFFRGRKIREDAGGLARIRKASARERIAWSRPKWRSEVDPRDDGTTPDFF